MVNLKRNNATRPARYTKRGVKCPNVQTHNLVPGVVALPGHIVSWEMDSNDAFGGPSGKVRFIGRMFARVDAPAAGPNAPEIKGWLAVLQLSEAGGNAFLRFVDPATVRSARPWPHDLLALLGSEEALDVDRVLYLDGYGSLSEHHIANRPTQPKGRQVY